LELVWILLCFLRLIRRQFNQFLKPDEIHASPDSLHYHVEEDGDVDFEK
jgi:hypothetical protein